jgi:predicted nucleic acid-binding protein
MIVVDVNVVAYLLIEGGKTELARSLRAADPQWRVPPLWRSEFLNVLAMQVQHGGFDAKAAEQLWKVAARLLFRCEVEVEAVRVLRLAAEQQITAYDAQYVALAQQLGVACVSEDRALQRKFLRLVFPMATLLGSR